MSKETSTELLGIESSRGYPLSCILNKKSSLVPGKRTPTFKVESSSVLDSVKAFLPKLAVANRELESVPASEVDIENTDNCSGQVIEMNLAMVQHSDADTSESDDSASDTDSESDSVILLPDDGLFGEVNEGNMQLPQQQNNRKGTPEIIILGETRNSSNGNREPELISIGETKSSSNATEETEAIIFLKESRNTSIVTDSNSHRPKENVT